MAPDEDELLGALLEELLLPASLLPDDPDGLVLAPPEAEPLPDFLAGSSVVALEELDEDPGVAVDPVGAGVLDAPPEGEVAEDELLEPEGVDGGVTLPLALPLVLPVVPPLGVVVVSVSWPQAARPKAIATAIARVESFMCPPWLAY